MSSESSDSWCALFRRLFTPSGTYLDPVFPLPHFTEPIAAADVALVAEAVAAMVDSVGADVLVGFAERSVGAVVHLAAMRAHRRYSLANWYPSGSVGDIEVDVTSVQAFSERGLVFVNGLKAGDRVVLIDDVVEDDRPLVQMLNALQRNGVIVTGVVIGAAVQTTDKPSLNALRSLAPSLTTLVDVVFSPEGVSVSPCTVTLPPYRAPTLSTVAATLDRLREHDVIADVYANVLRSFVGIPVVRGPTGYPYSNFPLTDFAPPFSPSLVESIAAAAVHSAAALWSHVDVIVSEADRGGGPMAAAIAVRTGLPIVVAGWNPQRGSATVVASVGYSGQGIIAVRGITQGARCLVVDDMLSSGGTCEALFRLIEAKGGHIQGAVFASEKVTLGGRERLLKSWPKVPLLSLCYFESVDGETIPCAPPRKAQCTPIQSRPPVCVIEANE